MLVPLAALVCVPSAPMWVDSGAWALDAEETDEIDDTPDDDANG